MHTKTVTPQIDVDVTVQGGLPGAIDYSRRKIGGLAKFTHQPVAQARVRLTNYATSGRPEPVVAQANLDLKNRHIRAQVQAATAYEAIDLLQDRLRRILEHRPRRWPSHGRSRHVIGEHHGLPAVPHWGNESDGEIRRVIRRKSFTAPRLNVDDAVDEIESMDYNFHLFTDESTGRDSVLYRSGPTGFRLAQTGTATPEQMARIHAPVTVSTTAPCELSVADAVERINTLDLPFLFFVDAARGRGSVLYRRYDGHYGLVSPAA